MGKAPIEFTGPVRNARGDVMMPEPSSPPQRSHWKDVYRHKDAKSVSWFRPHLEVSIDLLRKAGIDSHSRLIDVGGGASTLVDDLLEMGLTQLTVLDLSEEALNVAKERLGGRASEVNWLPADILRTTVPRASFDYWHDRAVLHFLTAEEDARRYAAVAANAVAPGGYAVISGFADDGPERCSGLPVARRTAIEIAELFAGSFTLVDQRRELHRTPAGTVQPFTYALLRRAATA